jgi:hypothetical protein
MQSSNPRSLEDTLMAQKLKLIDELAQTSEESQREALLKKIDELDRAIRVNRWLSSPGVKSPV